jgi:hypothetical protein
MAKDVRAGYDAADANPYDGVKAGQVNLWAPDAYHASRYGYYLEALTIFGNVTGLDPRSLGGNEFVARGLGIDAATASALQGFAAAQLAAEVPEPGMAAMFATLGGLMFAVRRRSSAKKA